MTVPATYQPRANLPSNVRVQLAHHRKRRRNLLPQWMTNETQLARIHNVYKMYLEHRSLPTIQAANGGISFQQIYIDIHRAEEELKLRWSGDLEMMVMEQVHARRGLILTAQETIDGLRPRPREDGAQPRIDFRLARAIADLLRTIGEQETAIEQLLKLRDKKGNTETEQTTPISSLGDLPPGAEVVVFRVPERREPVNADSYHFTDDR